MQTAWERSLTISRRAQVHGLAHTLRDIPAAPHYLAGSAYEKWASPPMWPASVAAIFLYEEHAPHGAGTRAIAHNEARARARHCLTPLLPHNLDGLRMTPCDT